MKKFMCENFLLSNDYAIKLYHDYAKDQPIYDYHSHLSATDLANNRQFNNLAQIWLEGDHYKWRAMRTAGVEEQLITGNVSDEVKYQAWANTIPKCIGNPLYHWSHMELQRYFGINEQFNASTADHIWQQVNTQLNTPEYSTQSLVKKMNVNFIGTTDDPTFDLTSHKILSNNPNVATEVSPSWRPDLSMNIHADDYLQYIEKLSAVCDIDISSYADLISALTLRLHYFKDHDCRSADHGIEVVRFAEIPDESVLNQIFQQRLSGHTLSELQISQFSTALNVWLAHQYKKMGWVMQLHIGAQRNNNTRMKNLLGRDAGYDSMSDRPFAEPLAKLLDAMDIDDNLPKTILYTLNPAANEMLATMAGNFQGGGIAGKIQFGTAWWFNDQKDGMERQLQQVSQLGLLSQFVGMLTDSRSFMSFTRHEYFRRILCELIGTWVANGEAPNDMNLLGNMIQDICFRNAKNYFSLE